jgi:LPS O-antigen subunit length determinant protein (WzzB/FepE family)
MDLDNIIYIIATIVIFVVSLLGQKKKKVEVPVSKPDEEGVYSLNDFEKILERKQEYRQPENVIEEVKEEQKEEVKPVKEALRPKKEKKNLHEEENQDGFDVKSAIIYSSILERKKFRH